MNIFHLILLISGFGLIAVYRSPNGKRASLARPYGILNCSAGCFHPESLMFMRIDVPNPMKLVEAVVEASEKSASI